MYLCLCRLFIIKRVGMNDVGGLVVIVIITFVIAFLRFFYIL